MKKMIPIIVFVVLGAGGFAASFFATRMLKDSDKPAGVDADGMPIETAADNKLLNSMAAANAAPMKPKERQLDELIKEVRAKLMQLDRRKRDLDEREKRLTIVSDQLKKQTDDIEKLRIELGAAIVPLRNARKALYSDRIVIRAEEIQNYKNTAEVYAKMDPSNAARILVGMIKNKQSATATKIFRFLPVKSAAAILNEINEMGPALEMILQQLHAVRQEEETA